MKLSKETITAKPKERENFCNVQSQSIANRQFLNFVKKSNKSKEKLGSLITSIHHICSTMLFGCKTPRAMQQVSSNASSKTHQINNELQSIQATNSKLNQRCTISFTDTIKKLRHKKSRSKQRSSRAFDQAKRVRKFSLSEVSTVRNDSQSQINNQNDEETIEQCYNQMIKLQQLKGEIRLTDQRKKYAVNKTYETKKHFPEGHFYRKQPNTIKYTPYNTYNKEDLYFKRNYNANTNNDSNPYQNSRNYHQSPTFASTKQKLKGKLMLLSSPTDQPSERGLSSDYYTQIPTTRATNENYSTLSYQYPKSAMPKPRLLKTQQKLNLGLLAQLNSDIYRQNEELKRIITEDSVKEEPKSKPPREKLKIERIRKEFSLDSLDPKIDENKILMSNADKVAKNLDERSKGFLVRIVREMMYTDEVLNRKFYEESNYDQKIQSIKEKKEMQKVVDQMMALKKKLKDFKAIEPGNEKEKMRKEMKRNYRKEWIEVEKLKGLLQKCRVMTNIKPLIKDNQKKARKPLKTN